MFPCRKTCYHLKNPKIKKKLSIAFLSDLHGRQSTDDLSGVLSIVREVKPDLILCGGDMMTANRIETMETAVHFYEELTGIAPVYGINGNHETYAGIGVSKTSPFYETYAASLEKAGVVTLRNCRQTLSLNGNDLILDGLEIDASLYRKLHRPHMPGDYIDRHIFRQDSNGYRILLAHNPYFAREYFVDGADLILCGHYHGGVMRFGKNGILVSPYGFPLPKFGYGLFKKGSQVMIVSAGLGEHRIPCRINNPTEVIHIVIEGE